MSEVEKRKSVSGEPRADLETGGAAKLGGGIVSVPLKEIVVPPRRVREKVRDVTALAESMAEIGLLHPISITPEKMLISGKHRLLAAQSLGWDEIEAKVFDGDELEVELAEIDENLRSHRLTRAEEAKHIARREAIMEARAERAKPEHGASIRDDGPPPPWRGVRRPPKNWPKRLGCPSAPTSGEQRLARVSRTKPRRFSPR